MTPQHAVPIMVVTRRVRLIPRAARGFSGIFLAPKSIIARPRVLLEQSPAFSSINYTPILFCSQDYHQPILLRFDSTGNKQSKNVSI